MEQEEKPGWKQLPRGGVITEAGNAAEYKTGGWRIKKPLWSGDKCIQCMLCWVYCPDLAIEVKNRAVTGVDYDHCKGCGICANQCPTKALEMVAEDESDVDQEVKSGDEDIEEEDDRK